MWCKIINLIYHMYHIVYKCPNTCYNIYSIMRIKCVKFIIYEWVWLINYNMISQDDSDRNKYIYIRGWYFKNKLTSVLSLKYRNSHLKGLGAGYFLPCNLIHLSYHCEGRIAKLSMSSREIWPRVSISYKTLNKQFIWIHLQRMIWILSMKLL